jgi:hypothetical protein
VRPKARRNQAALLPRRSIDLAIGPRLSFLLPSGAAAIGERGIMPDVEGIAGPQLKSFIERIERLEDEKRARRRYQGP